MQQREHHTDKPGPVLLPCRVHEVHLSALLLLRLAVLDDAGQLLRERARQPRAAHRPELLPRRHSTSSFIYFTPFSHTGKVNTNLIKQKLSRVDMQRQRPPHRLIIIPDRAQRPKEVRLPAPEQQELIKQVERRRGRLVYARHDNQIIPPRDGLQVPHHLEAGGRVEPGRRLVEEQHPRARHELRAHARAPLLPARDTAADRGPDQRARLAPEPQRREDVVDAGGALAGREAGREARGEGEGLAHCQGADQGVFLLYEAAKAAEGCGRWGGAVYADCACRLGAFAAGFACDVCDCGGVGYGLAA